MMAERANFGPERRNQPTSGSYSLPEGKPGQNKPAVPKKPSKRSKESVDLSDSRVNDLDKAENKAPNTGINETPTESLALRKETHESDPNRAINEASLKSNTTYVDDQAKRKGSLERSTRMSVRDSKPFGNPKFRPNSDYDGSIGYCRVKMGGDFTDGNQLSSSSDNESSEEDEVDHVTASTEHTVNASLESSIQHLHIHINLSFTGKPEGQRLRNTHVQHYTIPKKKASASHRRTTGEGLTNTVDGIGKSEEQPPPVPPKLPLKDYQIVGPPKLPEKRTDKRKSSEANDGYLTARGPPKVGEDYHDYETCDEQGRKYRDYAKIDEIFGEDDLAHLYDFESLDADKTEKMEEYQSCEHHGNDPEITHPWLFHYTQREKADQKIKTDKNGSFVVIEEDIECRPFTPYTVTLVHDGQMRHIPVIKHLLKRGKVRYSLANAFDVKQKSIQALVLFYQNYEIPGLKIKLKPPEQRVV